MNSAINRKGGMLIYAALMLSMFLSSLDQTVVSTALPTIAGLLGDPAGMTWVVTAYTLAMTIVIPVYGKLSDLVGTRHLFLLALTIFVAASVLCGFSQTMDQLVAFRFLQGLGGGGLMILSQAVIAELVPVRDRAKYMAPVGIMFAVSAVIGPPLGGMLISYVSWHWVFWFNVPLGLVSLAVAYVFLRLPPRRQSFSPDWKGFVVLSLAVVAVTLLVNAGGTAFAWLSWQTLALSVLCVVGVVATIRVERRAPDQILPLHLFANLAFVSATALGVISAMAMLPVMAYMPTYLQMVYGLSPAVSGYCLLPVIVGIILTASGTAWRISHTGHYRVILTAGMAATSLGCILLALMSPAMPLAVVLLALAVFGLGMGCLVQNPVVVVQNVTRPEEVGTATSANNLLREVGATLGVALVGGLFGAWLTEGLFNVGPDLAKALTDLGVMETAGQGGNVMLTPEVVASLSASLRHQVAMLYASALLPVFACLAPGPIIGTFIAILTPERPMHDGRDTSDAGEVSRTN